MKEASRVWTPREASHQPRRVQDRRRLGEVLVAQGLLTPEQLDYVLAVQRDIPAGELRERLGEVVTALGLATESQVANALAEALGLPLVDLTRSRLDPETVRLVPRAFADRHGVVVIAVEGDAAHVAVSDPTNVVALDDVRMFTRSQRLTLVVAPATQIAAQIRNVWVGSAAAPVESLFDELVVEDADEALTEAAVEAAPIVRLVERILSEAVWVGASDVHVEPQPGGLCIRYRVDGLLRDAMTVPSSARAAVVSRLKILSGLDIAERRRPQDGRAKLTLPDLSVEVRISTLPTLHGEKVVLRLMPNVDSIPLLEATGMTQPQLEVVREVLERPQGLILITGPTGSGKTGTLYAAIQQLPTDDHNVVTVEDPIEMQLPRITQVQVHERAGMTFARGLRSILRQDPDVVLVGEVRDGETAELALQASLTGHLVLTTLHTNDAVSAVSRLVDMGVEPYLVASSLSLVVAQRLVRRPCQACARPYLPDPSTLLRLGLDVVDLADATPRHGVGCEACGGTGYRGRTGVFEVLPITGALRRVLLSDPTSTAIAAAARDLGVATLRSSALAAASRGETTYEEVMRVTHSEDSGAPTCPKCARALADDMVRCPWDGTLMERHPCAGCGRSMRREWRDCPYCLTETPKAVAIPSQRVDTEAAARSA